MTEIDQRPYSPKQLAERWGVRPAEIQPHDDPSKTCGECGTFPEFWPADGWNCRRRGLAVERKDHACEKWRERVPAPEPDMEAMRQASAALMFGLDKLPLLTPPKEARKEPADLRGCGTGVVYFIDCGPLTKIGFTGDPIRYRMVGMCTDNPFPKRLWGLIKGNRELEKTFHSGVGDARYQGEWFRLSADDRTWLRGIISEHGGELYD